MNPRNAGESILLELKSLGVDYFFANPGTEFVSVIRGFQELPKASVPQPVMTPHEFQSVSMAYGYYLATSKPQAVMTHANVGAANALLGLIGASRMNIPLIFISGMTAKTERDDPGRRDKLIHWSQDSRDQGSLFREYVKWEAEITSPSQVHDILRRAYAIATTAPFGPVAIKVSRDVLVAECGPAPAPHATFISPPAPAQEAMDLVKQWLELAEKPLVITNRLGADSSSVEMLAMISKTHAMGVITPEDFYMSFPANHPNHLGYRPGEAVRESDLIFILETDAPWYPMENGPHEGAKVVHVGADPLFQSIPLRSHRGDLFVQSTAKAFLTRLLDAGVEAKKIDSRGAWIRSKKVTPAPHKSSKGLTAESVSTVLGNFLNSDTVLINELGLVPELLQLKRPKSYFRSGAASPLGWGMGCALGLALADRTKSVIACVGDGVFYLSPVLPALITAVQQKTPIIILILDNGGMASIAKTVRDFYHEVGHNLPLTSLAAEGVGLEKSAAVVSGLGLRAANSTELHQALTEAIQFIRNEKRPAIINAVIG